MNNSIKLLRYRRLPFISMRKCLHSFEPPYLDENQCLVPNYSPLNVQIKGYDFSILEKYGKWIHNIAYHMNIQVSDCWAAPGKQMHIKTYKPNSSVIDSTYDLQIYERNVQVTELSSINAPPFVEVITAGLPEGVELCVHEHMKEFEDVLYIPDRQLNELKKQLDDAGGPTLKKLF